MRVRGNLNVVLSLMAALFLVLTLAAQCGGTQPATQPPPEEKATEEVQEEKTIVFVYPEDPPLLNGYINDSSFVHMIAELVFEGLSDIDDQGNYYPRLAKELPTKENGGISEDGLTITWKLRDDVYWSDGEKFTSEDVRYTWQAITESETWAPGFDVMDDVETPDDYTVIVHYNTFYPNYMIQFGGQGTGIFPAHYCGEPKTFTDWKCNREPVGTGPFILQEWVSGDHITFVKNPNYWREGYPKADKIYFPIIPDENVRKEMIMNGDAHIDMWIVESFIDEVNNSDVAHAIGTDMGRWLLALRPNLSEKGSGDPDKPHPILADVRVRKAIRMAVEPETIINDVLSGYAMASQTEFFREPYKCDVKEYPYDPEGAKALLEEAGWKDEDGDGIRECHGCEYGEEGMELSMHNYIYAEYGEELELAQQLVADQLKQVGIELTLSMVESTVLWSEWESDGIEVRGNFDLDLWDGGYFGVEPIDYLHEYYACEAIPTEDHPGAGFNVMRYCNPKVDELLQSLRQPLTLEERKAIYCEMADIFAEELPTIPLMVVTDSHAVSNKLNGVKATINDSLTWNAAEWELVD